MDETDQYVDVHRRIAVARARLANIRHTASAPVGMKQSTDKKSKPKMMTVRSMSLPDSEPSSAAQLDQRKVSSGSLSFLPPPFSASFLPPLLSSLPPLLSSLPPPSSFLPPSPSFLPPSPSSSSFLPPSSSFLPPSSSFPPSLPPSLLFFPLSFPFFPLPPFLPFFPPSLPSSLPFFPPSLPSSLPFFPPSLPPLLSSLPPLLPSLPPFLLLKILSPLPPPFPLPPYLHPSPPSYIFKFSCTYCIHLNACAYFGSKCIPIELLHFALYSVLKLLVGMSDLN